MSVPHAELIQLSSVFLLADSWRLVDPRYALGLTTNNLCLSVCPCHKTLEIQIKTWLVHVHTFRIIHCWCLQLELAVSDTTGQRRQEITSTHLGCLSYVNDNKTGSKVLLTFYFTRPLQWRTSFKKKKKNKMVEITTAQPKRRSHVNLWCLLTLRNVCFVLNWQGTF